MQFFQVFNLIPHCNRQTYLLKGFLLIYTSRIKKVCLNLDDSHFLPYAMAKNVIRQENFNLLNGLKPHRTKKFQRSSLTKTVQNWVS